MISDDGGPLTNPVVITDVPISAEWKHSWSITLHTCHKNNCQVDIATECGNAIDGRSTTSVMTISVMTSPRDMSQVDIATDCGNAIDGWSTTSMMTSPRDMSQVGIATDCGYVYRHH
jgi:hypothetical protein